MQTKDELADDIALFLEVVEFGVAESFIQASLFFVFFLDVLDLELELDFLVFEVGALLPEFVELQLEFGNALLGLNVLLESEDDGTRDFSPSLPLIQGLVGGDGHLEFVANSVEHESSFSTVDSDLSYDLVKGL